MIDLGNLSEIISEPDWNDSQMQVTFTFRGGLTKTVSIDISEMDAEEIFELRQLILSRRKLIQSIFEHNTHGQITVSGLTVRADDLIAVEIS